ncbi:MAG: Hint domain-containing protein [Pseudomonadota bacterium]
MARISELHYSNALARNSGVSEFLEVALGPSDNPSDFVVSFYQANGSVGIEINLSDPGVSVAVDPDNNEITFVISADVFPVLLTDPDGGGATNYEAYALTNIATGTVEDFYDIGGGTQNITALDGVAAGAVSENVPVLVGPNSTTTTLQWNQPDPDTLTYGPIGPGDSGLACFVSGTLIDTPRGRRAVETLESGDRVLTRDHGVQAVRWVGSRKVSGLGAYAPVHFAAGTLGNEAPVCVSPNHRMLVKDWRTQLFVGVDEALIPARLLVDGDRVCRVPRPLVSYAHILLEHHALVMSHGLWSESLMPQRAALDAWGETSRREALALFPELPERAHSVLPVARGWQASAMH